MKSITIGETADEIELIISFKKLLATQNDQFDTRVDRSSLSFQKTKNIEKVSGIDEQEQSKVKRRRGTKATETKSVLCHNFQRTKEEETEHIISDLGGSYGHMKRALRRASKALRLADYKAISEGLIRFEPAMVDLGPVAKANISLTPVLEPRSRGTARELVLYETVSNVNAHMKMLISKTCPLTGEEISNLLTSLRDLDGFGPSSRGIIDSITIVK